MTPNQMIRAIFAYVTATLILYAVVRLLPYEWIAAFTGVYIAAVLGIYVYVMLRTPSRDRPRARPSAVRDRIEEGLRRARETRERNG